MGIVKLQAEVFLQSHKEVWTSQLKTINILRLTKLPTFLYHIVVLQAARNPTRSNKKYSSAMENIKKRKMEQEKSSMGTMFPLKTPEGEFWLLVWVPPGSSEVGCIMISPQRRKI